MSEKLRVVIADDHEEWRWAMAQILGADYDVVAAVGDGKKLIHTAMGLLPDVIVSDISMPVLSGVQAMDRLNHNGYAIPFVLVSTAPNGAEDYIKRGARAFVNKIDIGTDLVSAIFAVAIGQSYVSRSAEGSRSHALKCA